jgi:hypothetical protein
VSCVAAGFPLNACDSSLFVLASSCAFKMGLFFACITDFTIVATRMCVMQLSHHKYSTGISQHWIHSFAIYLIKIITTHMELDCMSNKKNKKKTTKCTSISALESCL